MLKLTNGFVAQVRDLSSKVTHLEEEKEKSTIDMRKLMRALAEKTTALEENTIALEDKTATLEEKTTALEEKEKTLAEKEERLQQLETELALLCSREINQGDFAELVVKKVLQTVSFGGNCSEDEYCGHPCRETRCAERAYDRMPTAETKERKTWLGSPCRCKSY